MRVGLLAFLGVLAAGATTYGGEGAPYGRIPLCFEPNLGQTDARADFLARGPGYLFLIAPTGATLRLHGAGAVEMRVMGADAKCMLRGDGKMASKSNYFVGNDRAKWVTGVPHHARVVCEDVYPGIDLVYYGNQRELEFDFVVGPGADPARIRLAFDGVKGLDLDADGALRLRAGGGAVTLRAPVLHQGGCRRVEGGYVLLRDNEIGFRVGAYDRTRPLVVDPVLVYSTYLGGNGSEEMYDVAVDAAGHAYVVGYCSSLDYPLMNPLQQQMNGVADICVTKFSPDGRSLVYSTYLGGTLEDRAHSVAVDGEGCVYLTGGTYSPDFPTAHAIQSTSGGGQDVVVVKLNATGSALVYSTYLGGSKNDRGNAIALDDAGNAHVTGHTPSPDFPVVNALQPTKGGTGTDAFVAKLDAAGSALAYSTYLGGSLGARGNGIAVDSSGNAVVAGETQSTDFPVVNALQPALGGSRDAFVAKLDPAGAALLFSTYVGGTSVDAALGVFVDATGHVYVVGETYSVNFPATSGAYDTTLGGNMDGFVAKIAPGGSSLVYATLLGGTGSVTERAYAVAVDASGQAHVTGYTGSKSFPTKSAIQSKLKGPWDAFVTKLNAAGSALVYSTYLGGNGSESTAQTMGIALDGAGNAYVTGTTYSTNFPVANPFQPAQSANGDGFLTKIGP